MIKQRMLAMVPNLIVKQ